MRHNMQQQLDWELDIKPVFVPDIADNGRQALVRSDNGRLLGIRSKNYYPVFNRDMELIKDRILASNLFSFKGYEEFQKGKRILAFFENRGQFKLCGQDVKDFLIIGNSHDTSSKLFVGTSNYMYRCENQFSSKIRNIEWKHTKVFDIDFLNIHDIIHSYEDGRRVLYQKMARLQEVRADVQIIRHLATQLMGSVERTDTELVVPQLKQSKQTIQLLECIETEIRELGPTLWGVFNGITRYTSNHLEGKPGFGIVNGRGEEINRIALNSLFAHC